MATIIKPYLFSWTDVEARSDLDRFYLVRDKLKFLGELTPVYTLTY
jgi:hypothetical protein